MQLILVRHADAEPDAATDAERPLTPLGHAQAAALCRALRRVGGMDALLSSPAVRARQTAEAVAPLLPPGESVVVTDALAVDRLDRRAIAGLCRGHAVVVLVGHMPDIAAFAGWLLTGSDRHADALPFEKCAAASIRFPGGAGEAQGVLEWFVPPAWFGGGG